MASDTVWGNQVSRWRCGVSAEVVASTDQTATVEVRCVWQSLGYGFAVNYNAAWVSCGGEADGSGSVYVSSATGETRELTAYSARFELPRGTEDRRVRCAAAFSMPDFQAGTSQAETYLTVPAEPCELPDPPSGATASVSGSVIVLEWANGADPAAHKPWTGVEVDAMVGSGDWGGVAGFPRELPGDAASLAFSGALGNSMYQFRVRSVNAKGASAWVHVGPAYTTPSAPANVSATFSDSCVLVTWTKTTKYAMYHAVQVSADGGETWSPAGTEHVEGLGTGAVFLPPAKDVSPPAGTAVVYRVAAVGPAGTSAWSRSGVISTYLDEDYPSVSITSPAGSFHARELAVGFDAAPGKGELTGSVAELVYAGSVVHSVALGPEARSATLVAADVPDGGEAIVRVSATNSAGLTSTAMAALSADYWPPGDPAVSAVQRGHDAVVTVASEASGERSAGTVYDLDRTGPDGVAERVAEGVACGEGFVDGTAPLNVPLSYAATVHSDGGKTATGSASLTLASRSSVLSFDGGGAYVLDLALSAAESAERSGEAIHFADGGEGGGLPEWYGGPDLDCSWELSATVRAGQVPALRRDMRSCGTVVLRDALGRVVRGHPSWSLAPVGRGRYWSLAGSLAEVVA